MHYIRFLRPPLLSRDRPKGSSVNISITITTDLGDSFLSPDIPIKLKVGLYEASADEGGRKPLPSEIKASNILTWSSGSRALKVDLPLNESHPGPLRAFAFPTAQAWAGSTGDIVHSLHQADAGRIAPVWADVHIPGQDAPRVSLRRLRVGKEESPALLEVEEEIGESIARHIWDAGLVTSSLLVEPSELPTHGKSLLLPKLRQHLNSDQPRSILELGCGVGILGLAVASALSQAADSQSTILLTDLPDAKQRTVANINRSPKSASCQLDFESLDWDEGRQGIFGPRVRSRHWPLIVLSDCTYNVDVLPALVGTLSALHQANKTWHDTLEGSHATRVLLATKPRHSSEEALFDLMAEQGWITEEKEVLTLPVLGQDMESVELYFFQRK